MENPKSALITFKVEPSLAELINRMPNRSEFIRRSLLASLANTCPLCQGTGVLTPHQREHWERFAESHSVKRCAKCHAVHLLCEAGGEER